MDFRYTNFELHLIICDHINVKQAMKDTFFLIQGVIQEKGNM